MDHAGDATGDVWNQEEKWINSINMGSMDFGNSFGTGLGNEFTTPTFNVGTEDDIINYGDFLNDGDAGISLDMSIWDELPQEG